MNILLIVTGSISSYRAPSIANGLRYAGYNVKVVLTEAATKFITKLSFVSQGHTTYTDDSEYNYSGVLHIDLNTWADIVLIAPCTANTLAKMYNGIADNLASCILRARSNNILFALAMNTDMYTKPTTQKHINNITDIGSNILFIEPTTQKLACGVTGIGALPKTRNIVNKIKDMT